MSLQRDQRERSLLQKIEKSIGTRQNPNPPSFSLAPTFRPKNKKLNSGLTFGRIFLQSSADFLEYEGGRQYWVTFRYIRDKAKHSQNLLFCASLHMANMHKHMHTNLYTVLFLAPKSEAPGMDVASGRGQ